MEPGDGFAGLVAIMDRLRGPEGCPWDREQDYESLRGYLIEECYEVAEALDRDDADGLREELGDLLFQIVFLSRLAKEQGAFTVDDVVRGIARKMVRRHPHVFGSESAETSDDVLKHWERIKRQEKSDAEKPASVLDGIPTALPALLKAQRLGAKAARVGFDWERAEQVLDKVDEELSELRRAVRRGDRDATGEELGDLLFSLVNLARHMTLDPEGALERANAKFRRSFMWIEAELARRGTPVEQADSELLESLWSDAKAQTT
jgi:tetrapyrrole methylase family protein/MazG family protein/ATP diphosphatase